jgi:hypothetical protein
MLMGEAAWFATIASGTDVCTFAISRKVTSTASDSKDEMRSEPHS